MLNKHVRFQHRPPVKLTRCCHFPSSPLPLPPTPTQHQHQHNVSAYHHVHCALSRLTAASAHQHLQCSGILPGPYGGSSRSYRTRSVRATHPGVPTSRHPGQARFQDVSDSVEHRQLLGPKRSCVIQGAQARDGGTYRRECRLGLVQPAFSSSLPHHWLTLGT